jgi:DNA-binding XRE family transcriptional regulator
MHDFRIKMATMRQHLAEHHMRQVRLLHDEQELLSEIERLSLSTVGSTATTDPPMGGGAPPACRECGGPMALQEIDHHERVGSAIVHDCSERHLVCVRCGNYDLTDDELGGYERRAALAYFRSRVGYAPEAEAVKFARKAIELTRSRLAECLNVSVTRVEEIEAGKVSCSRGEELSLIDMLHAPMPKVTVEWPKEKA